jgi:hypothetical protein
MITLLGVAIFVIVIVIGAADRQSGLRLFQKYAAPRMNTGRQWDEPWDEPEPRHRRQRRKHDH